MVFNRNSYQKYHHSQLYHHDCGLASLKMICNYYGITFDYQQTLESFIGLKGMNMLQICQVATELGLETKSYEFELSHLHQINFPCILVQKTTHHFHAVTCFHYNSSTHEVTIGDPAKSSISKIGSEDLVNYNFVFCLKKSKETRHLFSFSNTENPFWIFFKKLYPDYQKTYLRFLFLSTLAGILTMGTTVFIQKMIDSTHQQSLSANAFTILFLILILFFIKSALEFLFKLLWVNYQKDISIKLNKRLFNHLAHLPLKTSYSLDKGDYLAIINDLNYSITSHQMILQFFLSDFLLLLFYLSICAYYSMSILSTVIISTILPILFIRYKGAELSRLFENNRLENIQALNGYLEHIINLKFSPNTQANHLILSNTQSKFSDYYSNKNSTLKQAQKFNFVLNTLMAFTSGFMVFILFSSLKNGDLSIGGFSSLFSITFILLHILYQGLKLPLTLKEFLPFVKRCNERLIISKSDNSCFWDNNFETIKIDNYSLQHPQAMQTALFKNLNITLKRQTLTVISGENGKGKSLLLHALQGHYNAVSGRILIDNHLVPYIPKNGFSSFMPQNAEIFDGTLAFNISMKLEEDLTDIINFCNQMNLMPFIEQFPNGLSTPLGADKYQLSQGQKTLISFLRAIFPKPKLLVLDEPTTYLSALLFDFLIELIPLLKTRTTLLVVSHEPKVLALADMVYYI